ncbi:DUF6383 domain-containing protein [Parabacteroides distasonis]|uniref:DUF6383 domain-containing protein n=1 Tax=Parabacteroides distasonis TaxID=823 RepID=UPI0022E017AE|nr:DUF6383 domain-containing protein [Parabacteroides distasonis]
MNKKFTMLLASAMLATAFSAGAAVDAKKGDAILLKSGTDNLSALTGTNFGKLGLTSTPADLNDWELKGLNGATWTVSAKKNTLGRDIYSFENKATGLTLAVDPTIAIDADKAGVGAKALTLGGTASEWVAEGDKLVSYFTGDSVVYIAKNGGDLYLEKTTKAKLGSSKAIDLSSAKNFPESMILDAADLNTLLQSVPTATFFGLNMNPSVSTGKANRLTDTPLKATDVSGAGNWVTLQAKDKKVKVDGEDQDAYVVVDTAYYDGTETSKFLQLNYDAFKADNREEGSYYFKFTYNAAKDELYIQVQKVAYKLTKNAGETDADFAKYIKENNNNSYWSIQDEENPRTLATKTDKFIYMARLAGTNVLTINTDETDLTGTSAPVAMANVQKTVVKLGTNFSGLTLTTIPDGVYLVQYKASAGNPKIKQNGLYALANLAGNLGWANLARNQEFKHMPAAQWVVDKNGTSSTAMVTIDNREFSDVSNTSVLPSQMTQFYAVEGSDDVFYFNGSVADTLSFIKVDEALVKDTKLGYKYVTAEEASVQTYLFNYLHGLALNKYLYTPAGKDSIVRVDENGEKANFRLTLIAKDDKYGYKDGLVRNAYYVSDGKGRYISFDGVANKYMMKSVPTPFFLKENNCIDGTHYYTLVEANLRSEVLVKEGNNDIALSWYPASENGKKVADAKTFAALNTKEVTRSYEQPDGSTVTVKYYADANGNIASAPYYDKDGYRLIVDGNEIGDVYAYKAKDGVVSLQKAFNSISRSNSWDYASVKVSVDDNTLDLTEGTLNDKFYSEIRTSAFAVSKDDSPLYRRFNNAALGESETADSLFFVEKIRKEYLMDEWNKNLTDKNVDYAGIWNKEKADGKLGFIVDTAWVNRGNGDIKPQYLISVARNDQAGTPGIPCTYEHNHFDNAGNPVDAAHCSHATQGHSGFDYGKYLVSFGDSALIKGHELKVPYMDIDGGYTRVGFVKAIHAGDSLFVLTQGFENMDPATLDTATIINAYKKSKSENFIVNLQGDNHKNVTWSFRYVNPDKAGAVTEEGADNEFLFESNIYNEAGVASTGKATKGFDKTVAGSIAPSYAAWLKMQNGCLVLTRGDSEFSAAKTGSDGALIFNAYQKTDAEDMVTSIEGANAEGVSIITGNGTVTVQGAAGKSVVITNILGKVVAETVLTSDNATIAVPAGIVAVAVDGEEAVKAIVK